MALDNYEVGCQLPIKGNSDWSYAWIPLGPLLGALVGMGVYWTFTTFILGS